MNDNNDFNIVLVLVVVDGAAAAVVALVARSNGK